jgi:hypothetical protein
LNVKEVVIVALPRCGSGGNTFSHLHLLTLDIGRRTSRLRDIDNGGLRQDDSVGVCAHRSWVVSADVALRSRNPCPPLVER